LIAVIRTLRNLKITILVFPFSNLLALQSILTEGADETRQFVVKSLPLTVR